jgi:hypothetical protein
MSEGEGETPKHIMGTSPIGTKFIRCFIRYIKRDVFEALVYIG